MGLFRSKKTAKIEELTIKISHLELDIEELVKNNDLHKSNYAKQGDELFKLQEELKEKNSKIIELSKSNVDLEVKVKNFSKEVQDKDKAILELEDKIKDLPSLLKELNDIKISVLEKDAKISTLEVELEKSKQVNTDKVTTNVNECINEDSIDLDDEVDEDNETISEVIYTNPIMQVTESSKVDDEEDLYEIDENAPIEYIDLNSKVTGLVAREVLINDVVIKVTSWKGVYEEVVKYMQNNCHSFSILVGNRIKVGKGLRVLISRDKYDVTVVYYGKDGTECNVCEPIELDNGLYLESPALAASAVVSRVKTLCDFVGLSQSSIKLGVVKPIK